jgi:hypothetical protein
LAPAGQEKEKTKGCLGFSTWPQALVIILGLGLLVVILIVLPIVLVNTIHTPTNTTSRSNQFFFQYISIDLFYI